MNCLILSLVNKIWKFIVGLGLYEEELGNSFGLGYIIIDSRSWEGVVLVCREG